MRSYIIKGLLPWILLLAFFDGSLMGMRMGVFGALICLLILNYRALVRRFFFDWATLIYLVFLLVAGVSVQHEYLINHGLLITYFVLAGLCFFTLVIRIPFALPYARTQLDKMYWDNPILIRVCFWISFFWGVMFLLSGLSVFVFSLGFINKLWMVEILPTSFVIIGIVFTILFPDIYKVRQMKQGGVAAIPSISEVKHVTMGTIKIGYRILGEGPSVVLLNGSHSNMHYWDPEFLKKLSESFQVIILDYPGIGHSTYKNMPYTAEKIANCIKRVIDHLDLHPISIVGYSLGGKIAQTIAVDHPNCAESLILMSTDFGGSNAIHVNPEVEAKLNDRSGMPEEQGARLLSLMFSESTLLRMTEKLQKIFSVASLEGKVTSAMIEKEVDLENAWRESDRVSLELSSLEIPVLIITGKEDVIVPAENSKLLHQVIKQSKLVEYDDAGHGVIYQYPFDCADKIKEFLSKISVQ